MLRILVLGLSLLWPAGAVWAVAYSAEAILEVSFDTKFGTISVRTWDDNQRRLRTFIGRSKTHGFDSNPGQVLTLLEEFLDGVKTENLRLKERIVTADGAHFEYEQVVGEGPGAGVVENASLYFDVDRAGVLVSVFNRTVPGLGVPPPPVISLRAAECFAAVKALPAGFNCSDDLPAVDPAATTKFETKPTTFAVGGIAVSAYAVVVRSPEHDIVQRLVIDGRDGTVLERRDRLHSFDGKAVVFYPNPFVGGATPTSATVTAASYAPCVLRELDATAAPPYKLQGPFVKIADFYAPPDVEVTSNNGQFIYTRGSIHFAAAMIYCHVDGMQRYVQALGYGDITNRAIEVDPRRDTWNARYENDPPGEGRLWFGYSRLPTPLYVAEDGDVIAHEYGHALQASSAKSKYEEPAEAQAMKEGFADYWAMSHFYKDDLVEKRQPQCYGEWMYSLAGPRGCERSLKLAWTYRYFRESQGPHTNGMIWSGTLWQIFQAIGKYDADRLVLKSHSIVPDQPLFADGARAILSADGRLAHHAHFSVLCSIFVARDLLKSADCVPLIPKLTPRIGFWRRFFSRFRSN